MGQQQGQLEQADHGLEQLRPQLVHLRQLGLQLVHLRQLEQRLEQQSSNQSINGAAMQLSLPDPEP